MLAQHSVIQEVAIVLVFVELRTALGLERCDCQSESSSPQAARSSTSELTTKLVRKALPTYCSKQTKSKLPVIERWGRKCEAYS